MEKSVAHSKVKTISVESKVIFMQEFEISLFQFSNSMFTDKRQFSFKNILIKRFAKRQCGGILH